MPWLVALLLLLLCAAPAEAARSGPCIPGGPQCAFQTGRVTFVADGDTLDVDIAGDGTARERRVRLTGVQAMEQSRYSSYPSRRRGACHALAATARLEGLVRAARGRVRLAAQDPASRAGHRLRRQLSARIGRRWVDAGAMLLAEGHALWLPNGVEHAWNRRYSRLAQRAAATGLRLWNPAACTPGAAALGLELTYDAPGNDAVNANGETARVVNPSTTPVSLTGWTFRDSALRRYRFPAGTALPPAGAILLRMGRGADTADELHWGLGTPPFENPTFDARGMGDGGYLFDANGSLRAWAMYPSLP